MALSKDCQKWLDKQSKDFLSPTAAYFNADKAAELFDDVEGDPPLPGWYSCLSAPGYLDGTAWKGPFETKNDALEALCEIYGY